MATTFQRPNLFEHATKELAQDAFIAWLFSWIHQDKKSSNQAMQEAARSLLGAFLDAAGPSAATRAQVANAQVSEIRTQCYDADLWIQFEFPDEAPLSVLIEDKTHTSFHSGQLERARKAGEAASEEAGADLVKVYFKTGWIRRDERTPPEGFTLFRRTDALKSLRPHGESHPFLGDFVAWLQVQEEEEQSVRSGALQAARIADSFWHHAGLDEFLGAIFDSCHDEEATWYESGMGRGGIPWMHFGIHSVEREGDGFEEAEFLFWRADLRSGQPAISLRKYWKHSRSEPDKQCARQRMAQLIEAVERALECHEEVARSLKPHPRSARSSAYFEQELLVYLLGKGDGANDPSTVVQVLPALNRAITRAIKTLDG